jgi:hypothetical protein
MKRVLYTMLWLSFFVLFAAVASAGEVAQGRCVSFDQKGMMIVIEDYDIQFSKEHPYGRPTGVQSSYAATGAQIGVLPQTGDILRIAYVVKGKERVATKVMNVSKQDLMKK